MDAGPVRDVANPGFCWHPHMPPVLHPVAAVSRQFTGLVGTYPFVYGLMRNTVTLQGKVAGYLSGRPVFVPQQGQGLPLNVVVYMTVAGQVTPTDHCTLMGRTPAVVTTTGGVATDFTAYR